MSLDPTHADQVYRSLKRDIMSGRYPPGSAPNVHQIATEVGLSISPVRDAMERLVGERILVARVGGGFQMPEVSEASLSELYLWHSYLARGAIRSMPAIAQPADLANELETVDSNDNGAIVAATARFFLELAATGAGSEHVAAMRSAGERLAIIRFAEHRLRDRKSELERLQTLAISGSKAVLKEAIAVYHRRRFRHLSQIIRMLHPFA